MVLVLSVMVALSTANLATLIFLSRRVEAVDTERSLRQALIRLCTERAAS